MGLDKSGDLHSSWGGMCPTLKGGAATITTWGGRQILPVGVLVRGTLGGSELVLISILLTMASINISWKILKKQRRRYVRGEKGRQKKD